MRQRRSSRQLRRTSPWRRIRPSPSSSSASRAVARLDCAVGFTEDRYDLEGLPTVSYVARLKPKTHHSKAGNINTALLAGHTHGDYVLVLDCDMVCGERVLAFQISAETQSAFVEKE